MGTLFRNTTTQIHSCLEPLSQPRSLHSGCCYSFPPGSRKHPRAPSTPVPSAAADAQIRSSWELWSRRALLPSASLSTSYQLRKKGRRRATRMVIKIRYAGSSVLEGSGSSSAPLPALWLGKGSPRESPVTAPSFPLRLLAAPVSPAAATLRAPLSTHRTPRRPGGDSAGRRMDG